MGKKGRKLFYVDKNNDFLKQAVFFIMVHIYSR